MYKEIFIALCFVSMIAAYPGERVENELTVEPVQVEADNSGRSDEDESDLAVDESRYYGHRRHHHYGGGYRHYGGGYGGYGGGYYGGYRRGGYGYYG